MAVLLDWCQDCARYWKEIRMHDCLPIRDHESHRLDDCGEIEKWDEWDLRTDAERNFS